MTDYETLFELNKNRIGQTLLNVYGEEVPNSVVLRCSSVRSYCYWCDDRLINSSALHEHETELTLTLDQIKMLGSALVVAS